jgi:hypothetical protein
MRRRVGLVAPDRGLAERRGQRRVESYLPVSAGRSRGEIERRTMSTTTRPKRSFVPGLVLLAVVPAGAAAAVKVDERRPAKAGSEIHVESPFGSVEVVGTDADELAVSGTLAAGLESVAIESRNEDAELYVGVEVPEEWANERDDDAPYRTSLVVRVPRGSSVTVETIHAPVKISGVAGELQVETLSGAVTIAGDPRKVEVETVNGNIDVQTTAAGGVVEVESTTGTVTVRGAPTVSVLTVTGAVDVRAEKLRKADLETSSGTVRLDASLAERGAVDIDTFSGRVELIVPADAQARFRCATFGGQIQNGLGAPPPPRGKLMPFQELRFSCGQEEASVSVETYGADIVLRKRTAAKP